ncbi:MAG: head GIN domain-containing protein [Bacteroidales bacterium]
MKKTALLLTAFLLSVSAFAQVKETRKVADFTGVSFGVAGELFITQGSGYSVTIEASKGLLEDIETFVRNGDLVISKKEWKSHMNEKVTVWVTLPEVERLRVSGSGVMSAEKAVKSEELEISVSGSGRVEMGNLSAGELDCNISGSGGIYLEGPGARECDLSISGSGKYNCEDFKVEEMVVSISGSGNCRCFVVEELEARVSGSGDIYYRGGASVDARISGSGKVRQY